MKSSYLCSSREMDGPNFIFLMWTKDVRHQLNLSNLCHSLVDYIVQDIKQHLSILSYLLVWLYQAKRGPKYDLDQAILQL